METQEFTAKSFVTGDELADGEGPIEMRFTIRINSDGHLEQIVATDPRGTPWIASLKLAAPDEGDVCCCPDENGRLVCVPKGKFACNCQPK